MSTNCGWTHAAMHCSCYEAPGGFLVQRRWVNVSSLWMLASFALYQNVKLVSNFWIRVSEEVVKTAFRLKLPSRVSQCNVVSLILDQKFKLQRFFFPPKCEIFERFLLLEVGDYLWIT